MNKQIKKWQFIGIGFAIMAPISTVMVILFSKAVYGLLGILLGLILGTLLEYNFNLNNTELSIQELKSKKRKAFLLAIIGSILFLAIFQLFI